MLADDIGRWILENHEGARSEWQLTGWKTREDGTRGVDVTLASLDRTFVFDERRWIVDYKVIEPGGSRDVKSFLDEKLELYREQLETYGGLLTVIDEERPIELGLYFPLLGRSIWWRPGESRTRDRAW
jgi:hypothetical protein